MNRVSLHALIPLLLLLAAAPARGFDIDIEVAPNVLNIGSSSTVVTVHTDIGYGDVNVYSVQLNGVPIASWKADNQGNFVAKFQSDAVKTLPGLVIGGDNELILVGATWGGDAFVGADLIRVVDVVPRGR